MDKFGIKEKMKDWFNCKIEPFIELPIYNKNHLNDKINSKNYFWFSMSSLLIYPLVLAGLLWEIAEQKSIFQILKNQLGLWIKNLNMGMVHYLQLFKIIYGSCILIYLIVSILWMEVIIASGTDVNKVIKKICTIILFASLMITWGQLNFVKRVIDFISRNNNLYGLNISDKDIWCITYLFKLGNLIEIPLLFCIKLIYNFVFIVTYWFVCYRFKVTLLFSILVIIFELISYGIIWMISDGSLQNIRSLLPFMGLSVISILIANEEKILWISFIITIYCFYNAIKNNFDRLLLTNSFILFIGNLISNLFKDNVSNQTVCYLFYLFMSMSIAMYICEWFVLEVRKIKSLDEKEKKTIENVIKNLFGGLAGSSIMLIIIILEHFL